MKRWFLNAAAATLLVGTVAGCAAISDHRAETYRGDKYLDARAPSELDTTGIESSDLRGAVQSAVSKLLAHEAIGRAGTPPIVAISECNIRNDADSAFNANALEDLLRTELLNAAAGRVRVLSEDAAEACCDGDCFADYTIAVSITEVSQTANRSVERYTQITFQAVRGGTNEVVFADMSSFKKGGKGHSPLNL